MDSGEADIGIATESLINDPKFVTIPFYTWYHSIIVPNDHPLTKLNHVSLQQISTYPLITYHKGFTGRGKIDSLFKEKNLEQNIVLEALDADVIKAYVSLNLGIGIIASMAYDANLDKHLSLIDGKDIFMKNVTLLAFRKGATLRGYALKFASLCLNDMPTEEIYEKISGY